MSLKLFVCLFILKGILFFVFRKRIFALFKRKKVKIVKFNKKEMRRILKGDVIAFVFSELKKLERKYPRKTFTGQWDLKGNALSFFYE